MPNAIQISQKPGNGKIAENAQNVAATKPNKKQQKYIYKSAK